MSRRRLLAGYSCAFNKKKAARQTSSQVDNQHPTGGRYPPPVDYVAKTPLANATQVRGQFNRHCH
jgi:hypothetical protein